MSRGAPSEFELIDRFTRLFLRASPAVKLGIGDDCALLRPPTGRELAITTDSIVEGVHFSRAFTAEEIGHKALAVNLSDLAAMGATPIGFLCAIELPVGRVRDVPCLGRGMADLAREHRVPLVGGNFTRAKTLAITVTALGSVEPRLALKRSGARVGDLLFVSGELGGAARGLRRSAPPACLDRQRRPQPRLALGIAARKWARAGIDLSDGLTQDLSHLLVASGLAARLRLSAIPVQTGATLRDALSGGEDYELLLAVSKRHAHQLDRAARAVGVPLTCIGSCERGPAGTIHADGEPDTLTPVGHDHFATARPTTGTAIALGGQRDRIRPRVR